MSSVAAPGPVVTMLHTVMPAASCSTGSTCCSNTFSALQGQSSQQQVLGGLVVTTAPAVCNQVCCHCGSDTVVLCSAGVVMKRTLLECWTICLVATLGVAMQSNTGFVLVCQSPRSPRKLCHVTAPQLSAEAVDCCAICKAERS